MDEHASQSLRRIRRWMVLMSRNYSPDWVQNDKGEWVDRWTGEPKPVTIQTEKYVKVQIIVTDDDGKGYHLTAFRSTTPIVEQRENHYDYYGYCLSMIDDVIVSRHTERIYFDFKFEARPDPRIDDFRNIYEVKYLPRPEGFE